MNLIDCSAHHRPKSSWLLCHQARPQLGNYFKEIVPRWPGWANSWQPSNPAPDTAALPKSWAFRFWSSCFNGLVHDLVAKTRQLSAGDISGALWRRNCCFHFVSINCAKWPITPVPCDRKLQRQRETLVWRATCLPASEDGKGDGGRAREERATLSYCFVGLASLFFPFLLPGVTGCDANPSLGSRFSFTETHLHL